MIVCAFGAGSTGSIALVSGARFEIRRILDDTLIAECRQMLALIQMPEAKLLRLPESWERYRRAGLGREGLNRRATFPAESASLTHMPSGNPALSLDDIFISPRALTPPPTRRARFLSSFFPWRRQSHLATLNWGDLYNETDGQYAGAAREMLESGQWLTPTNDGIPRLQKPLLLYWAIAISLKTFGLTTAAARLPIGLAIVASVALTFLIGDRLGGPWRGFLAGLIHLCSCGTFLLGRIVMPEPVFSALIAGAIYCAIRGYERRRGRRGWFFGFWICAALACMTKSLLGLVYPAALLGLLSCFYREARCVSGGAAQLGRYPDFPPHRRALANLAGAATSRISLLTSRSGSGLIHLAGQTDASHSYDNVSRHVFLGAAPRLVVSVDDCNSSRRLARLATRSAPTRNRDSRMPFRFAGSRSCSSRSSSSGNDRITTR